MTLSNFQINRGEDRADDEEDDWLDLWFWRRRMAVALVVCYAAYAMYILKQEEECNEFKMSKKDRKRKARTWERELEGIKKALNKVAEALKEGNAMLEATQQRIYTEREVYAELVKLGIERNIRYNAYDFLTDDPARVRAFFGVPVNHRKDYLLHIMNTHVNL